MGCHLQAKTLGDVRQRALEEAQAVAAPVF